MTSTRSAIPSVSRRKVIRRQPGSTETSSATAADTVAVMGVMWETSTRGAGRGAAARR